MGKARGGGRGGVERRRVIRWTPAQQAADRDAVLNSGPKPRPGFERGWRFPVSRQTMNYVLTIYLEPYGSLARGSADTYRIHVDVAAYRNDGYEVTGIVEEGNRTFVGHTFDQAWGRAAAYADRVINGRGKSKPRR